MAINHKFNKGKDLLLVPVKDNVSLEDFEKLMKKIIKSKEFFPDTRTIWDFRQADFTSLNKYFAN